MKTVNEIKQRISGLKQNIAAEHALWLKWKGLLYPMRMDVWGVVDPAIRTKGKYYRAEIVREKQEVAEYMLGYDVANKNTVAEQVCESITHSLSTLADEMDEVERCYAEITKNDTERAQAMYDLAESILNNTLNNLKRDTEMLEEYIYGK